MNPHVEIAEFPSDDQMTTGHDEPGPAPRSERPREGDRPLVAVCGLPGGAGASTLAYLIAHVTSQTSDAPVLLCEAPAASGDQAALGTATSTVSLAELAAAVDAGRPPRRFWGREGTLRLLATEPQPTPEVRSTAVVDVLHAAAREHMLTVVDVGDVRHPLSAPILAAATHVLWVLRLEAHAVERARVRLAGQLVPALAARQAIAVRGARPRERFAGQGATLRRLASEHAAELILVPTLPVAEAGHPDTSTARAQRAAATITRFTEAAWRG